MTTMLLNQLGIIPAILITLTGLLILRGEDKERNTPRFLLFLLGVMVLFQLALLIIRRFSPSRITSRYFKRPGCWLHPSWGFWRSFC